MKLKVISLPYIFQVLFVLCFTRSSDLFRNFLSPSPICSCSAESEDAEHYLLRCPNFLNERLTLFHSTRNFHPLNVNILLFGDNSLTDEDNTRIFTAVQTFIKDSKRFVN